MALIGFICSILGFFVLPYIFGAVSTVLGILALQQKNIDSKGKKQAIAAIVLGIIDIISPSFKDLYKALNQHIIIGNKGECICIVVNVEMN